MRMGIAYLNFIKCGNLHHPFLNNMFLGGYVIESSCKHFGKIQNEGDQPMNFQNDSNEQVKSSQVDVRCTSLPLCSDPSIVLLGSSRSSIVSAFWLVGVLKPCGFIAGRPTHVLLLMGC